MDVTSAQSAFPPLALGFFGLGTGYLVYAPQELTGWPKRDERRLPHRVPLEGLGARHGR
jgi:hypothetical protein